MKNCKQCHEEFKPYHTKQKFCSDKCRYKYHDKNRKANRMELITKYLNWQRYNWDKVDGLPNNMIIEEFFKYLDNGKEN